MGSDKYCEGLVSVIIPAFNSDKYITRCLNSILRQTYRKLEVIVVDDGSTDQTAEIVSHFLERDSRVHLLHQENKGTSAARNCGLDKATGEYLTFIDADDYVAKDYIKRLQKCCEDADAEMVICGLCLVNLDGKVLKKIVPDYYKRGVHEEWTFRISAVCSHFYRRHIWEDFGIRFAIGERGEDMTIALFFSAVCKKIEVLPYAGYAYVQHNASTTKQFRGLRTWNLPLRSLEESIVKAEEVGVVNDRQFFELFVMRILCTCFFDLARGADREKIQNLAVYIVRIVEKYLPDYCSNKKMNLFSGIDVPISQKAAVSLMRILVQTRLIYPMAGFLSIFRM